MFSIEQSEKVVNAPAEIFSKKILTFRVEPVNLPHFHSAMTQYDKIVQNIKLNLRTDLLLYLNSHCNCLTLYSSPLCQSDWSKLVKILLNFNLEIANFYTLTYIHLISAKLSEVLNCSLVPENLSKTYNISDKIHWYNDS